MITFVFWYLIITLLGFLTFPLAYKYLPALEDRGYALSRILGLLLWGYIFWLLGSLKIFTNNIGGEISALIILGVAGGFSLKSIGWREVSSWIKTNTRMIIVVEILFLTTFMAWTFIRSFSPEILGTEKPMELAFINSILRSPTIPPNDPWLSGYSISYYYFGFLLIAMIARLANTSAGIAFNLGVALIFALTSIGSYSILFNLIRRKNNTITPNPRKYAILGPFFILIVSNMGGILQILRIFGVFWNTDANGQLVSKVWSWLDIGRYGQPLTAEAFPHWWWWQASRIVQDFDFNWVNKGDIIDEFPFFSFLLGDLHPHVLAIPFAFLAISISLNLFAGGGKGKSKWLWMNFQIEPMMFLLSSVVLGSLAFFNTWDFPFYVALFAGAYILSYLFPDEDLEYSQNLSIFQALSLLIRLGFVLGVSGIILYLPFYFGFQSQAGGPLPNLIYVTRGVYTWIHFAPLLIPICGFLFLLLNKKNIRLRLRNGFLVTICLVGILFLISMLLSVLISNLKLLQDINPEASSASNAFLSSMAAPSWSQLILEGLKRRLMIPGTLVTLIVIITLSFTHLWPESRNVVLYSTPFQKLKFPRSQLFVLLLILIGALLVLTPEFIFLRDLFGYRINTIFKFYFQVWLLWGISAAYALIRLWQDLQGGARYVFRSLIVIVLVLSLTYPVMGLWTRTNAFQIGEGFSLDGTNYLKRSNPDEAAAIDWLKEAPMGYVAEAIGGSYTQFARMATNSGQPTVLGWDFHELQWRGGVEEMGSRRVDIERLYCTRNWDEANSILKQYNISYVVVGSIEQTTYGTGSSSCPSGLNTNKFTRNLILGFQQGTISIYQVPEV